jgi:hypothetical protein
MNELQLSSDGKFAEQLVVNTTYNEFKILHLKFVLFCHYPAKYEIVKEPITINGAYGVLYHKFA